MKRLYQATRSSELERCDLCAVPLGVLHDHLYDPRAREVNCACQGCAPIIPTAPGGRYRRIPRRLESVELDAKRCLAVLGVPVGIVAVIVHDDGRPIAGYPGPTGLVESEIDPNVWSALCAAVPAVGRLEREVEALFVCSTLRGGIVCGIDVVFKVITELLASRHGITSGPDPAAVAPLAGRPDGGAAMSLEQLGCTVLTKATRCIRTPNELEVIG